MPLPIFNNQAHDIIIKILDDAEERLVKSKEVLPDKVGDYLTELYIDHCVSMISGGSVYLESDERNGASYFLIRLCNYKFSTRVNRLMRECETQLLCFTKYYFPNFEYILRLSYINDLRTNKDYSSLHMNGRLQYAARILSGVRHEIRRECRHRGWPEPTLVLDADMAIPRGAGLLEDRTRKSRTRAVRARRARPY